MFKRFMAVLLSVGLILGIPSSAGAYNHWGYYLGTNNDALGDGDIDVCFESGSPPHTNKLALLAGYGETWSNVITHVQMTDRGTNCFGANIEVIYDEGMSCSYYGLIVGISAGDTFAQIKFNGNPSCGYVWDWGTAPPVTNGRVSAQTVWLHEIGHALGLGHVTPTGRIMTPGWCVVSKQVTWPSQDDASGVQTWYPAWSLGGSFPSTATCTD